MFHPHTSTYRTDSGVNMEKICYDSPTDESLMIVGVLTPANLNTTHYQAPELLITDAVRASSDSTQRIACRTEWLRGRASLSGSTISAYDLLYHHRIRKASRWRG
jgi:hypothetical protein